MGTHPIFESDFDCLTDCKSYIMEQYMQGDAQKQAQKQAQMEDQMNQMLTQLLDQGARARLNNISMVNPSKAKKVEAMIVQMARQGQIPGKLSEAELAKLLDKIPGESRSTVNFRRQKIMDSDSESD